MKRKSGKLFTALGFIASFVIWTILVLTVDVQEIGQNGTNVGFASFNSFAHKLTGVHMSLYTATDFLSLIPVGFVMFFALLGAWQLIKRKSIFKVDRDILFLGGFYAAVALVFVFFEIFVINYRPILINGNIEASYPSSTTLLSMCMIPTAIIQFNKRIKKTTIRKITCAVLWVFTVFMVTARLISGVHWITDIIGGALISTGLVLLYLYFIERAER